MTLPNFLNIGTMKGGTTSLFYYLDAHPDIYMPRAKELHYFVAERNWERGLSWYKEQFAEAGDARAVGEASPSYTNYPQWKGVPERIAKALPDIKLIYVMRDPIERMKSHYRHEVIMGREDRAADEALTTETSYFYRSCYALQLEQYLEHFPMSRLLLITSEELREKQRSVMSRIYEFLSLPESVPTAESEFHRSEEKRRRGRLARWAKSMPGYERMTGALPEGLKKRLGNVAYKKVEAPNAELSQSREAELRAALASDVVRLSELTGRDFTRWGFGSPD